MTFASPDWLIALPLVLVSGLLAMVLAARARRRTLLAFAETRQPSSTLAPARRLLKNALLLSALLLGLLALARPQWGHSWQEIRSMQTDILFAVDVSRSMLAEDTPPNRLQRAKLAILERLPELASAHLGLIAYAGEAFLLCPPTLDHDAFRLALEELDTDTVARGGSHLATAIREARATFPLGERRKILILLSDGEDHSQRALEAAAEAAKDNITLHTIGLGTTQGALIPVRDTQGRISHVHDEEGRPVMTRLEEETLRRITALTEGQYFAMERGGLRSLQPYLLANAPLEGSRGETMTRIPTERFQLVLLATLLLLVIEPMLSERRRQGTPATPSLLLLLSCLFLIPAPPAEASPPADLARLRQEAARHYTQKDYAQALQQWQQVHEGDPSDPDAAFALGATLYRLHRPEEAAVYFEKALRLGDPQQQAKALYNLGKTSALLAETQLAEAFGKEAEDLEASTRELDQTARQTLQTLLHQPQRQDEQIAQYLDTLEAALAPKTQALDKVQADLEQSQQFFQDASEIAPDLSPARDNLAILSARQQQTGTSRKTLDGLKEYIQEVRELLDIPPPPPAPQTPPQEDEKPTEDQQDGNDEQTQSDSAESGASSSPENPEEDKGNAPSTQQTQQPQAGEDSDKNEQQGQGPPSPPDSQRQDTDSSGQDTPARNRPDKEPQRQESHQQQAQGTPQAEEKDPPENSAQAEDASPSAQDPAPPQAPSGLDQQTASGGENAPGQESPPPSGRPDAMTQAEAADLLDALRSREKKLPVHRSPSHRDNSPEKNW